MASRRTKIYPKSGRGLGHVTPTICGSTVGYPSESLASCFTRISVLFHHMKRTLEIADNDVGLGIQVEV